MPTPPKPASILGMEKRSHRTKRELEQREKAEKAQLTGKRMKEAADVKNSPEAHAVWLRVKGLLGCIGKDDALYEQLMNRYCRLSAETVEVRRDLERLNERAQILDDLLSEGEIDKLEYLERASTLAEQKASIETMLMRKRKMMLDIEKENVMTIAASLRAVPKKPQDEAPDPMEALIRARG